MSIQDIYILRDSLPVYHYKNNDSILKKSLDASLITGFFSAIFSFIKETGLGIPDSFTTNLIKFSFFESSDLLYVICSDSALSNSIVTTFFKQLSASIQRHREAQTKELSNSQFIVIVNELLYLLQRANGRLLKPAQDDKRNEHFFKDLIPKRHIDEKDFMRNNRRKLFKLIDGKNSIYDLALFMNQSPSKILNILRSYQKEGIISF